MSSAELWQLGAAELARQTRAGDITATEAVTSAIARMDAVNPDLNAVVVDLRDAALSRAATLDTLPASDRGPLHGVPVTIKINVDQKGEATSNGIPAFKDLIAPADAPVVETCCAQARSSLAAPIRPEFSFRADTDNPLFGRTHNPWGKHISAGGSSGGGGAAVMAGIGALAHGNDIGGSLRFPSAANGAVTVKPGLGRVPAWNPSQRSERGLLAQMMSVQGLMCRTAEDLAYAMPSLIAPDPRDPFHAPVPWHGPALDAPVKIAFTRNTHGYDLHPEVEAALLAAATPLWTQVMWSKRSNPPICSRSAATATAR